MTVIFGKVYIYHNNTMLYVKRIIKEDFNPIIDKWKELLDCDLVLKKEGKLYFCQTINEAEIVEDEQV